LIERNNEPRPHVGSGRAETIEGRGQEILEALLLLKLLLLELEVEEKLRELVAADQEELVVVIEEEEMGRETGRNAGIAEVELEERRGGG